jgi:hypothetical protein
MIDFEVAMKTLPAIVDAVDQLDDRVIARSGWQGGYQWSRRQPDGSWKVEAKPAPRRIPTVSIHTDVARDGENALRCPTCDYEFMHHGRVTVYDRAEDAKNVTKTIIDDNRTSITTVPSARSGNPSSRRNGLAIRFWCEGCEETSELMIEQTKGRTFFSWRSVNALIRQRRRP